MLATPTLSPRPAARSAVQARLAAAILERTPQEGRNPSPWPGLFFVRVDRPSTRLAVIYESCLCIVAQGSKRAFLGDQVYAYDPLHYLVLSVPLPLEAQISQASPEEPFLSLSMEIETSDLADLMLEMADDRPPQEASAVRPGICVSAMHEGLASAVLRLLAALDDPMDRRILAPLARREILYHLLAGEQGHLLRSVALQDGRSHRIARALRFVRAHFDEPLDVATIARAANLSPSALHHTFKALTSASPLQYLKQIRLHHARLLMLHEGLTAAEAAHRVGYGSPSQFSREFRRLFGAPPARQVQHLRESGGAGEAA